MSQNSAAPNGGNSPVSLLELFSFAITPLLDNPCHKLSHLNVLQSEQPSEGMISMRYDDIDDNQVPEAVAEEITNLLELDTTDLIRTVLAWGPFYAGVWARVCREQPQSQRLRRIQDGTCQTLATGYMSAGDAWTGTLMTALWCMPNAFLDDVLRINDAVAVASRTH